MTKRVYDYKQDKPEYVDVSIGDYYVTMRDMATGNRSQYHYTARDFAHAFEQAKEDVPDETYAIIEIVYDY